MNTDTHGGKPERIRRRAFIGRMAMKAAYVTPAVVALKAAQKSYAGPSGITIQGGERR